MKHLNLILTIVLVAASMAEAKIENFNEMIRANVKAENNLHQELRNNQGWEKPAYEPAEKQTVVLKSTVESYSPHTKKSLLKFQKEQVNHQPEFKKQMGRVATEVKENEQ